MCQDTHVIGLTPNYSSVAKGFSELVASALLSFLESNT